MNPLRELINLMEEITGESQKYLVALGDDLHARAILHSRLMSLLTESIDLCQALSSEDDDLYTDNSDLFDDLWKIVTFPNDNWAAAYNSGLDRRTRSAALNLARVFDSASVFAPVLTTDQVKGLRVAFEKIRGVLSSETGIPENARNYLIYLVQRGLDILDGQSVDINALRSISFEVTGAVAVFNTQVSKESRKSIVEAFKTFWTTWFPQISVNITAELAGEAFKTAIGS